LRHQFNYSINLKIENTKYCKNLNFLRWINTTIYFTNLLSKSSPSAGGTNSFLEQLEFTAYRSTRVEPRVAHCSLRSKLAFDKEDKL